MKDIGQIDSSVFQVNGISSIVTNSENTLTPFTAIPIVLTLNKFVEFSGYFET